MTFKSQIFEFTYQGTISSFGMADFNRDGKLDFLFGGPTTPFNGRSMPFAAISVDKNGIITNSTTKIMASVPHAIHGGEGVVADLNGDGRPDFFSGNSGYDVAPWKGEPDTLLLSGADGKLHDVSATLPRDIAYKMTHTATAGDIDGDGDLDLLSGVIGDPYLLINDGKGRFSVSFDRLASDLGAANDPERMILESKFIDTDSDGDLDLVAGFSESSPTAGRIYENDGSGHFLTGNALPVGLYRAKNTIVTDILDMDVNNDGHMDMILSETAGRPYYQGQKLQILINDGKGNFRDETAARMKQDGKGLWNQEVDAVDFNGDGFMDLVASSDYGDAETQTMVWINNGYGKFTPLPKSALKGFEGGLVAMDFNKDGNMDFLSFRMEGGYYGSNGKWVFKSHLNIWNTLKGTSNSDSTTGTDDRDMMYGYGGNDTLKGAAGNDKLMGSDGNDRLFGGAGKDWLSGGSSKDAFVFDSSLRTAGVDSISDFKVADDSIYLDNKVFTKLGSKGSLGSPSKLSKSLFTIGDKAKDANDFVIYDKAKGALYYDADGSGEGAQIQIAKMAANLKMTYADFFVI